MRVLKAQKLVIIFNIVYMKIFLPHILFIVCNSKFTFKYAIDKFPESLTNYTV